MHDFLIRLRLPLLFATLVLLTLISMLTDRRALVNLARERSFGDALIEVTVPVQKVLRWPFHSARGTWSRYVSLVGLKQENERLLARVAELEEQNLQYAEAIVAAATCRRSRRCAPASTCRCTPPRSWATTCRPGSARC